MEYYLLKFFVKHKITKKNPRRAAFFTRRLGKSIFGALHFLRNAKVIDYFWHDNVKYYYVTDMRRAKRWLKLKKPKVIMRF